MQEPNSSWRLERDTVGVSCPFCLQMFEEGIESVSEDSQKARDLLEILDESLKE